MVPKDKETTLLTFTLDLLTKWQSAEELVLYDRGGREDEQEFQKEKASVADALIAIVGKDQTERIYHILGIEELPDDSIND